MLGGMLVTRDMPVPSRGTCRGWRRSDVTPVVQGPLARREHPAAHPIPDSERRGARSADRCGVSVPERQVGVYGGAMTDGDYPWEPPFAGTEAEQLVGALDRLRTTFRWKVDDLDAAGLRARIGASSLTLGGLLKHLAVQEDYAFTTKLSGEAIGAPWDLADWDDNDDWEFTSAANDTPEQLYALWDGAVERSGARLDAALADGGVDQLVHLSGPDGRHASLRRLLCDLIEEYGRHTGHADLLREAVDGLVGEDPPAGWHATGHRSRP
jgi:hypothetical protein